MIGPERAIGCVVYPAAEIIKPGIVRHVAGNKFTLCEPDGRQTDRVLRLAELMARAGLEAPINPNIREEIWLKLAANMSVNPTGVLTGGTIGDVVNNPEMARLAVQLAAECQSIAKALGIQNQVRPDQLVDRLRPFSAHKTSMVQDFEARRTLEIDPVIGAVHELAQLTKTPAPTIANVLALVKLKAHLAGL
jgi:2-dehydropantoate 2-reductase